MNFHEAWTDRNFRFMFAFCIYIVLAGPCWIALCHVAIDDKSFLYPREFTL